MCMHVCKYNMYDVYVCLYAHVSIMYACVHVYVYVGMHCICACMYCMVSGHFPPDIPHEIISLQTFHHGDQLYTA